MLDGLKVLCTGSGTSGSYQIRAVQLGAAIGATVIPKAESVAGFDLVVVVKRMPGGLLYRLRADRVPWVLDVVDGWPQPTADDWSRDECMAWLGSKIREFRPTAIVAATQAMADDCAGFGVPVLFLPHHARPELEFERNPIRKLVRRVGYAGSERYIVKWRPVIEAQCRRRDWLFHTNPQYLGDMDIVLALRDSTGYAARNWKSCVKMSNAMGSGTPFIACREAGYIEQDIGNCVKWADNEAELSAAFDELTSVQERRRVAGWLFAATPQLDAVATKYKAWLEGLPQAAVASGTVLDA